MLAERIVNDTANPLSYSRVSHSSQQSFHQLQSAPAGGVPYLLYIPPLSFKNATPLVLIHGISRNIHQHMDAFADYARQSGRILIAPLFDETNCPRYQLAWSRGCRADQWLLAVLRDVCRLTDYAFRKIALFGFSGGAQFGHRFAMLYPDIIEQLAIASAGWYTFPDEQVRFPYGISMETSKGKRLKANLQRFLSIPVLVLAGELDIKRDANLRKGRGIDQQQGRSRVERAARWARAIQRQANMQGIKSDISFETIPNSTHDFNRCAQQGNMVELIANWMAK